MAHAPKNPRIPTLDGVSPSCLALPHGPTSLHPGLTLLDHLAHRLPKVSRADWHTRMAQGRVLSEQGTPLPPDAPYTGGQRIYYWRHLADEPALAVQHRVLHADAHLVVADKPHGLPVTPGGRFVQETLLVRLKRELTLPDLTPIHRIDRETAGLVVFCVQPAHRDAYQRLFRDRAVHKTYEAIAPHDPLRRWPHVHRSHLLEDGTAFFKMREAAPHEGLPVNSETHIDLAETAGPWARYRLTPVTGKRHQLRVHMWALGLPLWGDQFYPVVRHPADEPDIPGDPLRLLAQELAFEDPITGQRRHFCSQQTLAWPPA